MAGRSLPPPVDSPAKHAVVLAEAVVPSKSAQVSPKVVVAPGRWLLYPISVPRTDNLIRQYKRPRTTAAACSAPLPLSIVAQTKAALAGAVVAAVKSTPSHFRVGDKVEALWTDVAGQAYYEATIIDVHGGGTEYEIEWCDQADEMRVQPVENVRPRGTQGLSRTA